MQHISKYSNLIELKMMKKKYLMNGMALLALGLTMGSCSKETGFTEKDAVSHAEKELGVTINSNTDWKMTQEVKANVSVNLGFDQQYTVAVYDVNPLFNEDATYYAKKEVNEGGTVSLSMDLPQASNTYYVAVFDSKFRGVVEAATITDGELNVNFGGTAYAPAFVPAFTRATQDEYSGTYAKTAADYLEGLTVSDMQQYEAFTNADIDKPGDHSPGHINLDGGTTPVVTKTVSGSGTFYVESGFNPNDGQTIQVKTNDNVLVGTLTFEGSGSPAVAKSFWMGFDNSKAVVTRTAVKFVPAIDGKMSLAYEGKWAPFTWTDNGVPITMWGNTYDGVNGYKNDLAVLENAKAGHVYRVCYNDGISFAGVKHEFSGTVTTGGETLRGDGRHFRVASGTTITEFIALNGNDENNQPMMNGAVIYVEGKLNLYPTGTLNGVTIVVGSGGEVVLNGTIDMSTYGRFVVLPGGKITGTSGSSLKVNNGAKCYNAGEINFAGELNVNGSDFYNCGTLNLGSMRNTSGGKVTNFGKITCGSNEIAADAYNCEMINGCYWHYTGNAGIGHLIMLKNSRLDVDGYAEFSQSWSSGFDASSPANALAYVPANPNILEANSVVNIGVGFFTNTVFQGPSASGEVAILKMQKAQVANGTDLMQRQNCYFDWDITELYSKNGGKGVATNEYKYQDIPAADKQHNKYGYLVDFYREHILKFITEASSPVSIPTGDCTGDGYNPGGGGGGIIPGGPAINSYAFEDSYNGDYDMNDVVVKVQENPDDATKLDFYLMCTGASYDLYVYLTVGGMTYPLFNGPEVHAAMGGTAHMFINTGTPDGKKFDNSQPPAYFSMAKPAGIGNNLATLDIWIQSPQGDIHVATPGQDPHGVVIPSDWKWPKEYQSIKLAYPDFVGFANPSTRSSYLEWYKNPDTSLIYQ